MNLPRDFGFVSSILDFTVSIYNTEKNHNQTEFIVEFNQSIHLFQLKSQSKLIHEMKQFELKT